MMNSMYADENIQDIESINIIEEQNRIILDDAVHNIKKKEDDEKKRKEKEHREQKEAHEKELLTQKIKEQVKLLNEYVSAFINSVGRKPDSKEIELNMKDSVELEILHSFLEDYKFDDFMNL